MAISAATPYLVVLPLAAGIVAAAVRRPWLAAGAVVAAGLLAATQVPLYVGGPALAGPSLPLRIVTSNMKYGQADPIALVELVRDGDVDVLFLQELTSHGVTRLTAAGIGELLPYQLLRPSPQSTGAGIYSRHPLTALDAPGGFSNRRRDRDPARGRSRTRHHRRHGPPEVALAGRDRKVVAGAGAAGRVGGRAAGPGRAGR